MLTRVSMFLLLTSSAMGEPAQLAIIPQPRQVTPHEDAFTLGINTQIVADTRCMPVAEYLHNALRPATGLELPIRSAADADAIILRTDSAAEALGTEGYRLNVTPQRIEIVAFAHAGLFYGVQTLRQLLPPAIFRQAKVADMTWQVPCVEIEDSPRFAWRGAHLDVSRHFMPKDFVLKFLDLMALHKLNHFHWHLTDDTGWRLQIKQYPRLTEIGAQDDFSSLNPNLATRSVSLSPGGYYTQDDVREIVAYAAQRFITVVPEIELPGHSWAALRAYPELGNAPEIPGSEPIRGVVSVYNVDDETITFLKHVFDEVFALFPSTFIHIGGDEVSKEPWKHNPRAQAHMKALGLKTEEELQSWFIRQFDDYLTAHHRRLIGWDEILEGGLAPGAAVMSWRGTAGGIKAAQADHDVVMAPTSHTYFDYCQARPTSCEPPCPRYLPLKQVYAFEPVPPELSTEQAQHILGAQFQLWSERIPNPQHMEYMAYPRGCALAEVVWSAPQGRDYEEFLSRLSTHLKRLDVLDVSYRPLSSPDLSPIGAWHAGEMSETFSVHEWDMSSSLTWPGNYVLIFEYTHGAHALKIDWVEIVENGKTLLRLEQDGHTGGVNHDNEYVLQIPKLAPDSQRSLRASVRTDGGTDSNGNIYLIRRRR